MDIIQRNFFRLLRSGALNEYEALEPMSLYKWGRLTEMLQAQQVTTIALKGIRNSQFDREAVPQHIMEELTQFAANEDVYLDVDPPQLSNILLNNRLKKIRSRERHAMDTSLEALQLLDIIVANISSMLNRGISLHGILQMGSFLRTKGDKVDFVKLDNWIDALHIRGFAELQASILVEVFKFDTDEIEFLHRLEPQAQKLTLRTLRHTAIDTAQEWHLRQTKSGFIYNNPRIMRRNLRRSMRYLNYGPVETVSNFVHNIAHTLSEIEE